MSAFTQTTTVVDMPVVAVLAGGLSTRMRPLTARIPKSMLQVAGEPFIAHQLRLLRREGVSRAVLCVGHLAETIDAYVGDGANFGVEVRYSYDGADLLGTGGALRKALSLLGPEFMVMYGDSYLDIPFAPVAARFRASGLDGVMTIIKNSGASDDSNVTYDGRRILHYDKKERRPEMNHIDFGLSILKAEALEGYPVGGHLDLADVYSNLVRSGRMGGFEVHTRFYEIGSPAGLADTDAYLASKPA